MAYQQDPVCSYEGIRGGRYSRLVRADTSLMHEPSIGIPGQFIVSKRGSADITLCLFVDLKAVSLQTPSHFSLPPKHGCLETFSQTIHAAIRLRPRTCSDEEGQHGLQMPVSRQKSQHGDRVHPGMTRVQQALYAICDLRTIPVRDETSAAIAMRRAMVLLESRDICLKKGEIERGIAREQSRTELLGRVKVLQLVDENVERLFAMSALKHQAISHR